MVTDQFGESGDTIEVHFDKFHWHEQPEEYSILFETLYDHPGQRREHIESCIGDNIFPSWGYIYLINLIKERIFNVVLTTNFDDLLNEAAYQFSSDVRPMVCAHDSSIRSLRITSKRPKIIKLHGDFLFDNIKNTMNELESLEENMRDKLKQIACEYSLIVVGYAGNDRSIMDCISSLLKNDIHFPHGIYWCVRKKSSLSDRLNILARDPRVNIIEIDGFDEFFANVHNELQLSSQPELSDPYKNLTDRLNGLLEKTNIPDTDIHPVINADIVRLRDKLAKSSHLQCSEIDSGPDSNGKITFDVDQVDSIKLDTGKHIVELPVPYSLLAQISEREQEYDKAFAFMLRQLEKSPRVQDFYYAVRLINMLKDPSSKIDGFIELLMNNKSILSEQGDVCTDIALELIQMSKYDEAQTILNLGNTNDDTYRLNTIQILKYRGEKVSQEDLKFLNSLKTSDSKLSTLGALILLEEKGKAIELLNELFKAKRLSKGSLTKWPIFKLLTTDDPLTLISSIEE